MPSCLEDVFFRDFLNKTELEHVTVTLVHPRVVSLVRPSLQIFVAMRQNGGNYKLPDIVTERFQK